MHCDVCRFLYGQAITPMLCVSCTFNACVCPGLLRVVWQESCVAIHMQNTVRAPRPPPVPCAAQIHQLNSTWSEQRKAGYVRHAVREYTIHKALRHTNIVTLSDIFEVSCFLYWLRLTL
eukprot:GHRQ01032320.1.p2 GENE.GHRQ01032320.1~~GHRQ01032320.1.p2  ORF type:complete len:119 (-),score=23.64 GHRQ01032320.1:788-1144(-)